MRIKRYLFGFLILCFVLISANLVFAQEKIDVSKIASDKVLSKEEQTAVKAELKGKIFKELTPAKNDYVDKYDRGTVEFNPKKGTNMLGREVFEASNYSFQKVIIPDGTVIREVNFTQKEPHTKAIIGKDLTFIDCNLVNVELDPSWTVQGCNTAQIKRVKKSEEDVEGGKKVIISHQVEKDGKFVEVTEYEEIVDADSYSDLMLRLNK